VWCDYRPLEKTGAFAVSDVAAGQRLLRLLDESGRLNPEILALTADERGIKTEMKLRMPRCRQRRCWPHSKVTTCFQPSSSCRRVVAAIKPHPKQHSRAAIQTTPAARRAAISCARLSNSIRKFAGIDTGTTIIRGGVASHHAGHIPAWKLVIEKLMSAGLLDAIFATATVAAGVDFPARSVVLTGADARTGSGWRRLSASEMQQMTGRAGRRGRDNVGFVIAAPGMHQDPQRIAQLLKAPPDPLVSQFRATYTTFSTCSTLRKFDFSARDR
jgi:hypothetical protein